MPSEQDSVNGVLIADAGNRPRNASTLTPDSNGEVSISGAVGSGPDSNDYFTFVAGASGDASFNLSDLSANINLHLFNSIGSRLQSSTHDSSNSESINYNLIEGQTYYLRVDPWRAAESSYSLSVNLPASTSPTVPDTSSPVQSTPAPTGNGFVIASETLTNRFSSGYDSTYSYAADSNINSLLSGSMWGYGPGQGVTLTYSFPDAGAQWAAAYGNNEPGNGFQATNQVHQQATTRALNNWAEVANIHFNQITETASTVGDIRVGFSDAVNGNTAAWAYLPSYDNFSYSGTTLSSYTVSAESSDIWINPDAYDSTQWQQGSDNYHTLMHEIGHSLGLKHTFDTDGNGTVLRGDFDTYKYSVMSYSQHRNMGNVYTDNGDGTYSYQPLMPSTPLLYDIQAIQYMYGANYDTRTGDDTYSFSSTVPFIEAIWDAGGNDTLDASNQSFGVTINLGDGELSSVGVRYLSFETPSAAVENLAIAFGAVIENAVGSIYNDTLTGNTADNMLTGGAGNDTLNGGDGIDTAVFSGHRDSYQVVNNSDSWQVYGTEGTDMLFGIEKLQFSDQTILIG